MSFSTPGRWIGCRIIGLLIVGLAGCRILPDELEVSESGRLLQLPRGMSMPNEVQRRVGRSLSVLLVSGCMLGASNASDDHKASEIIGTWRGTSTCTDRVAAPACRDEVVVYDFAAGAKPGSVRWKADKVVDGKREPMGEMDLAYDAGEKCWAVDFGSPRVGIRWCLVVDGDHLTGTGRLLPGKETVRRVDARRD